MEWQWKWGWGQIENSKGVPIPSWTLCQDSPSTKPFPTPFIRIYPTPPSCYINSFNLRILLSPTLTNTSLFLSVSGYQVICFFFFPFILCSFLPVVASFQLLLLCGSLFLCPVLVGLSSDLNSVVAFSSMLVFLAQVLLCFLCRFWLLGGKNEWVCGQTWMTAGIWTKNWYLILLILFLSVEIFCFFKWLYGTPCLNGIGFDSIWFGFSILWN